VGGAYSKGAVGDYSAEFLVIGHHENVTFGPCRGHPRRSYSQVSAGRVAEEFSDEIAPQPPSRSFRRPADIFLLEQ